MGWPLNDATKQFAVPQMKQAERKTAIAAFVRCPKKNTMANKAPVTQNPEKTKFASIWKRAGL